MKTVNKLLAIVALMLIALSASSTDVRFTLSDPQFGISQTTNRTVIVQAESGTSVNGSTVLLPFRLTFITDSNGVCTASNLFGSPIAGYYHITVPAPPQRADFDIWVQQTNLGLVQASSIMGVFGASTYPAAVFAWGAQISDARYQLNGTTLSNTFYPLFSNPSNYVPNSILLLASNALASSAGVSLSTVTNIINAQTNGLATTNYVNTATNSFATTNYVGANYYPTSNPSLFVGASITNGFATTNYANGVTNSLTDTARKAISYFQPANGVLTNLSGLANTNQIVFTNSTLFDSNGVALLIGANLTNDVMMASNAVYKAATNAVSSQSAFNATNGMQNGAFTDTNLFKITVTNVANASSQSATNGFQQGITNIINGIAGSGNFIARNSGNGTNTTLVGSPSITVTNLSVPGNTGAINLIQADSGSGGFGGLINLPQGWQIQGGASQSGSSFQASGVSIGSNSPAPYGEIGSVVLGTTNDVGGNLGSGNASTYSTILGGTQNKTDVRVDFATIVGGQNNTASASYAYAMGVQANPQHRGSWVYNVPDNGTLATTGTNQFLLGLRGGGVGINTNNLGTNSLKVVGNIDSTVGFSISGVPIPTYNNVVSQRGVATNIVSVGYLSLGGGLTFVVDTNVIGVTNCGNPLVNGTYQFYNTGSAYTNLNDNRFVIMFSNPTWFLKGTNNSLYQSTGLTNAWTVVGSPATPVPTAFTGGYIDFTGFTRKTPQEFLGTNDPNGIVIAPIGSTYIQFTNGLPKVMLVNTNGLSGWY